MAAPTIVNVYPANGSLGITIGDRITVLFDQEMDESSINAGSFVVIGPTKDFIFGRDFTPLDAPGVEDEQILNSPYTGAYVEGTFLFERLSLSGLDVIDVEDTTGSGGLYRTRATFIPNKPLTANVEYRVLLAGDEDLEDDYRIGVRTRSVFDTVASVSDSASIAFAGSYLGATSKVYQIEITSGGRTGSAEYIWWDDDSPLITYPGITTTGRREIDNGVYVTCDPDSVYTVGDTFSVVCTPGEALENNYSWAFTTGSGSIVVPPSTSSTSGIGDLQSDIYSGDLQVVSIRPDNQSTNLDPDNFVQVIVTFNKELDETTIANNTVTIWTEPVNGDNSIQHSGVLAKILSVSGNTLTIQIPRVE